MLDKAVGIAGALFVTILLFVVGASLASGQGNERYVGIAVLCLSLTWVIFFPMIKRRWSGR